MAGSANLASVNLLSIASRLAIGLPDAYFGYQTIKDDSEGCVDSEGVQGFSISVTRRRYVDGEVVSTETWPTHYKPTPNVVCSNPTVVS